MYRFEFEENEQIPWLPWVWLVKRRAGFRCERCPAVEGLQAHHKDRDRANCCLANGECLCKVCHDAEHAAARAARFSEIAKRINPTRRGIPRGPMSAEGKAKIRAAVRSRSPEYYVEWVARKRANGTDLSEVARKGWETRRRRAGESNS